MSYIAVIASDEMGHAHGDPEIGKVLMKVFMQTLTEQEEAPTHVLLYNAGVRLNQDGEDCVEDFKTLEAKGSQILSCGTCLDYFEQDKENLPAGEVGGMKQFVQLMREADHIVRP